MIVRLVIIGIDGDRGIVALQRFVAPAEMQQDVAAKQKQRRVVRIGRDAFRGPGERILEPLLLHQHVADVDESRAARSGFSASAFS